MTQEDPNKPVPTEDPAKQGGGNGGGQEDRSKWTPTQWKQFAEATEAAFNSTKTQLSTFETELNGLKSKQTEAEKKAAKDEEDRKKKQGEFEQLAGQYQTERDQYKTENEALKAKYDKLSDLLNKQVDTDIKDWPAEVKAFDPGKDAGIEVRMAWVPKGKALAEKLIATPARRGNGPNPTPTGSAPNADVEKAKQAVGQTYQNRY